MSIPRPLTSLVLSTLALSCAAPAAEPEPAPAPEPRPAAEPSAPAKAPHAEPSPAPETAAAASLSFAAQEGWVADTPSSTMRKAQFRLPGAAGEASLVVYHFGPQAGTLEANLERWAGQFEQPDGVESQARMTRTQRRVDDLDVLVVDLSGTYVAETFPGSGERVREEGWRMLAAVIETPEGPYYAKLVGPAASVAEHSTRFDAFLEALR